jgi:hypothetical protein
MAGARPAMTWNEVQMPLRQRLYWLIAAIAIVLIIIVLHLLYLGS